MKTLLLLLLLCASALCSLSLPDIDDSSLGALLAGDWQSLLPQNLQDTRTQLLKLLTPTPTTAPVHMLSRRPHYKLSVNGP